MFAIKLEVIVVSNMFGGEPGLADAWHTQLMIFCVSILQLVDTKEPVLSPVSSFHAMLVLKRHNTYTYTCYALLTPSMGFCCFSLSALSTYMLCCVFRNDLLQTFVVMKGSLSYCCLALMSTSNFCPENCCQLGIFFKKNRNKVMGGYG